MKVNLTGVVKSPKYELVGSQGTYKKMSFRLVQVNDNETSTAHEIIIELGGKDAIPYSNLQEDSTIFIQADLVFKVNEWQGKFYQKMEFKEVSISLLYQGKWIDYPVATEEPKLGEAKATQVATPVATPPPPKVAPKVQENPFVDNNSQGDKVEDLPF